MKVQLSLVVAVDPCDGYMYQEGDINVVNTEGEMDTTGGHLQHMCFISPHSFPLPTHTHTCTLKFMTTLEKAVKLGAMIVHVHALTACFEC